MPLAPWEDLDDFLDPDMGFAVVAQIIPSTGPTRSARVIFDESGVNAALGKQYVREDTAPVISGKASDFAGLARKDRVIIAGRTFDVMESPEPDGTGWATLRLSAQAGSGGR
ncbi:head-tail joining protein [Fuscibacter oryzae]|uniref:Uncharacterized protein n=1 Tax=Fuscibacter oryzae TaxID=2803939 RepID=A0A8J7MUL7_9RHOB|nr:hypothetical protein [Fuscibacter oryzae]MBL4929335.1 hypothetical protein [Fuscibacter oryzae]